MKNKIFTLILATWACMGQVIKAQVFVDFSDTTGISIGVNNITEQMTDKDPASPTYFEIVDNPVDDAKTSIPKVLKIYHDTTFNSNGNIDWYGIKIIVPAHKLITYDGNNKYIHIFAYRAENSVSRHFGVQFNGFKKSDGSPFSAKNNWMANIPQTKVELGEWKDYVIDLSVDSVRPDLAFDSLGTVQAVTFAPGRDIIVDGNYHADGEIEFVGDSENGDKEVTYIGKIEFSASAEPRIIDIPDALANVNQSSLIAFPNPASTIVNIKGGFDTASLINIMGQVVITANNSSLINTTSLNNGLYMLKVSKNGNTSIQKVVIK